MAEQEESLVMRRSRRSTAGNRMEAALAEFKAEELGQDAEEDVDFVMEVDEQDAFGSDFESTDEEGAQEDVDATAEKMVREQEAPSRKAGRTQLEKVTAAAHARQKATFHPDLTTEDSPKPQAAKIKRRVSMGVAVDAETGAVLERSKRHSMRSHTLLNTSMSDLRAKDELEKKSTLPRRTKTKIRAPTQDELIARALDMEEGNIKEHRNFLELEEEKRRRARVIRTAVHGPLVRYISKAEQVTVEMKPSPSTSLMPSAPPSTPLAHQPGSFFFPSTAYSSAGTMSSSYTSQQSHPHHQPGHSQFVVPQTQAGTSPHVTFIHYQQGQQSSPPPVLMLAPPPPPPEPESILVKQTVTRNYLVHEMAQEDASRPLWKETMEAVFGDHANWEEMRAYHPKNRPTARILDKCPITGRTAIYRDPRSGVPFASADAYRVLSDVLAHKFLWSESLGCYLSPPDSTDGPASAGTGASTTRTKT